MGPAVEGARVRDSSAVMWTESGLVSGGDVGLRHKFGKGDAGHDEHRAGRWNKPETFARNQESSDPCKSGLEGEDERHRRCGKDGLCPALNGEGPDWT